jgi:2'-5' RNA ligase
MGYSPKSLGYVTVRLAFQDWKGWRDNLLEQGPAAEKPGIVLRRVNNVHITLLFGIHPDVPQAEVEQILSRIQPFRVELTGLSLFQKNKRDILKLDVAAPELQYWHEELKALPHTLTEEVYRPHATVAYLRSGYGTAYVKEFEPALKVGLKDIQYTRQMALGRQATQFYSFGFAATEG